MSKGINKVILVGNLGQDPEVRYTQAGAAITSISIATTDSWTDKTSGQRQDRTEWHRVVFFNRLAEVAGEYLRKGSQVYVEGSLRTRKWQDDAGQDKFTTEVVASELQMLGGKKDGNAQDDQQYDQAPQPQRPPQNAPQPSQQAQQRPQAQRPASPYANVPHATAPRQQPAPPPTGGFDDFDDDGIPFN